MRPSGFTFDTIFADLMSKSSSRSVSISFRMYTTKFSSSSLPKSMMSVLNDTTVSTTASRFSSFLPRA